MSRRRPRTHRCAYMAAALTLTSAVLVLPIASQAAKSTPAPKPPGATTGGTQQLDYSSATLNATINPHGTETTYYFQYGPTTAYGTQTPSTSVGAGTLPVRVSQSISGLQMGISYHFRVVAVSAVGTTPGQDRILTTKSLPLKFEIPKTPRETVFGKPVSISGSLTGTGAVGHQVVLQASQFPYLGGFTNIGAPQVTNANGQFAFRVTGLSQNTQLRVSTMDARPIYSSVVNVHVALRVTLRAHATARKGYVQLSGTVTPAALGASVAFQLLRPGRGPLTVSGTTVKKASATVARFNATVFIPSGRGGSYRAYVRPANNSRAPGFSHSVLLRAAPARQRKHH